MLFYSVRAALCAGVKVLSDSVTYSNGVVIFPYLLPTHRSAQSKALGVLQHYSSDSAHGEVHYPCGLGDESRSVRAEVHSPEGVNWGLLAKDRNAMVLYDLKEASATVGNPRGNPFVYGHPAPCRMRVNTRAQRC